MKQEGKNESKLEQQQNMVERMGVYFEQRGLRPMYGRVFAYLLLAEPPYKSFYDIQDFLKASKSTISTALNFFLDRKIVKYTTFSGDRRRYFQVDIEGWFEASKQEILEVTTLKKILEGVLEHRSDVQYVDYNEELDKMVGFYEELSDVLGTFIQEWEKKFE